MLKYCVPTCLLVGAVFTALGYKMRAWEVAPRWAEEEKNEHFSVFLFNFPHPTWLLLFSWNSFLSRVLHTALLQFASSVTRYPSPNFFSGPHPRLKFNYLSTWLQIFLSSIAALSPFAISSNTEILTTIYILMTPKFISLALTFSLNSKLAYPPPSQHGPWDTQ